MAALRTAVLDAHVVVDGVERAVFGAVPEEAVDAWLARHLRARLSSEMRAVRWRSGRIAAVYGVRLADAEVVVKVHRAPADAARLAAAAAAQDVLAATGYPCPRPLDGPATTNGVTATVETALERGERANAREPAVRRALAGSLARQVDALRSVPADALVPGAPGWAVYAGGPWPVPHDPIFDFSRTPPAYAWLDRLARDATDVLAATTADSPPVLGHSDWVCQNVRFAAGEVSASYDWDSLVGRPEPVLAGLSAGSYTEGSTAGDSAPSSAEAAAFLADYDGVRGRRWTRPEQAAAAAAATWVLAYNARCDLSLLGDGRDPALGSALATLGQHGDGYLGLRW